MVKRLLQNKLSSKKNIIGYTKAPTWAEIEIFRQHEVSSLNCQTNSRKDIVEHVVAYIVQHIETRKKAVCKLRYYKYDSDDDTYEAHYNRMT